MVMDWTWTIRQRDLVAGRTRVIVDYSDGMGAIATREYWPLTVDALSATLRQELALLKDASALVEAIPLGTGLDLTPPVVTPPEVTPFPPAPSPEEVYAQKRAQLLTLQQDVALGLTDQASLDAAVADAKAARDAIDSGAAVKVVTP